VGLLSEVLLLPFAPVRGSAWVIQQVVAEAERQYYDPEVIRAELAHLERRLEAGEVSEEEFDRLEDELLDRLEQGGDAPLVPGTAPYGAAPGTDGAARAHGTTDDGARQPGQAGPARMEDG
jgi:hypothetical protein